MLAYVPASFVVIRHVRTKLSCTKCDCIVQAEAPSRPIERGLAGPGLLAHVLVSKYCDHQPLYRQSEIYASRCGTGALDDGRLGRREQPVAGAADGSVASLIVLRRHPPSTNKKAPDIYPAPFGSYPPPGNRLPGIFKALRVPVAAPRHPTSS
jgi:transposase